MCRSPRGSEVDPERPLLSDGQAVLGRFAIDEKATFGPQLARYPRSIRPIFLAHQKQQPDPPLALTRQALGGCDHGGGQPLGVAAAAAVDRLAIFAEGNVRWDSVQVRGKDQRRKLPECVQIIPAY